MDDSMIDERNQRALESLDEREPEGAGYALCPLHGDFYAGCASCPSCALGEEDE
jgi:hypothetical protein